MVDIIMYKRKFSSIQGFTLIELLVVIAIIGILSSITTIIYKEAVEKGRIAKTQHDIRQIATAMYLYKNKYGELPPIGDLCPACNDPCGSGWGKKWTIVMDALVKERLIDRIDKDAWDNGFCYDDNDGICCGAVSALYSMGPNKKNESIDSWWACQATFSGDDFGVFLPEGDRACP